VSVEYMAGQRTRSARTQRNTGRGLIAAIALQGVVVVTGAQAQEPPTLTITVVDPTGALIVGARVEVTRSDVPVRLARLTPAPFTTRLVNKFALPVAGWRGPGVDRS